MKADLRNRFQDALSSRSQAFMVRSDGIIGLVDPADEYGDLPTRGLIEACGFIPSFLDGTDERSARVQLEERYGFGPLWEAKDGSFNKDTLAYEYPGDPDLYPYLVLMHTTGEVVAIYPYGMVAIVPPAGDQKPFLTRMD